jgi:hypothetical protein
MPIDIPPDYFDNPDLQRKTEGKGIEESISTFLGKFHFNSPFAKRNMGKAIADEIRENDFDILQTEEYLRQLEPQLVNMLKEQPDTSDMFPPFEPIVIGTRLVVKGTLGKVLDFKKDRLSLKNILQTTAQRITRRKDRLDFAA